MKTPLPRKGNKLIVSHNGQTALPARRALRAGFAASGSTLQRKSRSMKIAVNKGNESIFLPAGKATPMVRTWFITIEVTAGSQTYPGLAAETKGQTEVLRGSDD